MLATAQLPQPYVEWNQIHGAPYGRNLIHPRLKRIFLSEESWQRLRGPFTLQVNNTIRRFEYPWAFIAAKLQPKMRVLEIGGGLSGFQFVLDSHGCSVVNVDPGMDEAGWPCNQESMRKLNRRFAANVELRNTTIEKADLLGGSFDRAFSISVIEHLPEESAIEVMKHVHRCLKPGGLFVLTSDLFLNLKPFCSRQTNEFGRNQNIRALIDEAAWELLVGDRACLYGFPEFNPDFILSNLEKYFIGIYPALAQCLIIKKR
jgi:2-polyprenyl-3-methyl-5-hydroxy-6-metoxy-1,4-benzoquinol methylase